MKQKALVIFSGGQDSTTCLGWALNRYSEVTAITFQYGQKHIIEIDQSRIICEQLNVPQFVLDVSFFGNIVHSALTEEDGDMNQKHEDNPNLPSSYVPNRNAFFITLAHSYAQTIKAEVLVIGVCQTDYSGYPDCRDVFIKSIETSLNLGSERQIEILTPLMNITKAETFQLAKTEKVFDLVLEQSHTCYNGSPLMNSWGRGCGDCPACGLRQKGYEEFLELEK
ncbi:MAG: 7-cyano-7-deazaguanine synthase [bacterium]|jgi:7-cyano-7-deazaguanine synthase